MMRVEDLQALDLATAQGVSLKASRGPNSGFFDWTLSASLQRDQNHAFLCVEENRLQFVDTTLSSIVRQMIQFYGCCYGYAYLRELKRGADLFAVGMIGAATVGTKIPSDARTETRSWMRAMTLAAADGAEEPWCKMIRGVFALNVLSDEHLGCRVGKVSLRQWIAESSRHGRLEPLAPNLSIWSLTEAERRAVIKSEDLAGLMIRL
jgi:hypothetical protein